MGTSLKGKKIVFTGATSGLGKVALNFLIQQEAKIFVLYRNDQLIEAYAKEEHVIPVLCDLSSIVSIQAAIESIQNQTDTIDILVNNAGLWEFGGFKETVDGYERTFQVNLMAPYLLVHGLLPLLKNADSPKVITTASALHQGTLNFDDLQFRNKFSGFKAYRQSKLGVILLTRFWATQHDNKICFVSQHPGVVNTDLGRDANWFSRGFFKWFGISPEKGARTLIHLLQTPAKELVRDAYYANAKVAKTTTKESYNMASAEQLNTILYNLLKNRI